MTDFVEVGQHRVQIKKRKGQRTIRLRVNTHGEAVLSMPYRYPKYFGASYLKIKQVWLDKHTFQINQLKDGSQLFTGQKIVVSTEQSTRNKVKDKDGEITFYLAQPTNSLSSQKYMASKIKKLYIEELTKIIDIKLTHFSEQTGLGYKSFVVKSLHSKWGSCDRHKNLQFSLYLMGCSNEMIDYVVLHELVHTKHMHHQKEFWALCKKHMPDYEDRRKQLKKAKMLLI
ncbi:MAG: YgjP-like metallopeptidase domain-containing protein [Patescibacteria group bacterium]